MTNAIFTNFISKIIHAFTDPNRTEVKMDAFFVSLLLVDPSSPARPGSDRAYISLQFAKISA